MNSELIMQEKKKEKIWLSSPHMGGKEQYFVKEAFDANWVAPLGPNVNAFEKDLENYLQEGVHVAAVSSGTAALHLALILLGVERGDEVLCQSFTFSATANAIAYLGAIPVFIDSEKDSWNLCPDALKEAIEARLKKGKKPKAIIAVSLYGMPYKAEEINALAEAYGIPVIEDSAEALGSKYKNKRCGTFGEISILSFNGNKIITTSGGGALVSKNPLFKEKAIFLSTQAREEAPHYEHKTIGYNYRMSNICAGIGRGQMEVLEERVAQRRANHQFYEKIFTEIEGVRLHQEPSPDYFSNYWLSTIVLDQERWVDLDREKLRLEFLKENIETRPLWKPMHLQPVFKNEDFYGEGVSQRLFDMGLCLPSGSNLTEIEKERIFSVLSKVFNI